MCILWNSDKAMSVTDIHNASKNTKWSEHALYPLVKKLTKMGLIAMSNYKRTTTNLAGVYTPRVSREEYLAAYISYVEKTENFGALDMEKLIQILSQK